MKEADARLSLFADYALNRARGCLLRGESEVHLRPQAYQLLHYLAERRGVLIHKDEIIEAIWHGRAVGDDSLVQCLRDVRHALGEDGARRIRTVRGRGYVFDVDPDPVASAPSPASDAPARSVATPRIPDSRPAADPHRWRRMATSMLLLAGLLAVGAAGYGVLHDPPTPAAGIEAIAVLPFLNETADDETEYLADGGTESLINSLAQLPYVSVKARSTVFKFKGKQMSPQEIATELSVQAVVDGRVVRRGDSLVASLALVDGRTGNQLWGQQYIYKLADLPAMQRQMALDLARTLQVRDGRADVTTLTPGYTSNGDAYLLYLRGRYHFLKSTEPEIRAAIDFYQRAADVDPGYALAYWGLADAHRALAIVGQVPSNEAFPKARAAAMRALELDPKLAEAHIALGWIGFSYDWDWATAERELQTAIALSPGNTDAHRAYAHLLSNQGRHQEALVEAARARELDPRSALTGALEGQFLFYAGQLDQAERRLRRTLAIEPDFWVAHQGIGRVYLLRDKYPEAIAAFRRARQLSGSATETMTQLAYAMAKQGDRAGAIALYDELERRAAERHVPAYSFAMIRNGLGEKDEALRWLERSVTGHEVQATFLKIDTRWDALRPDPRFVALLGRINLAN
ncbi:MAG: tetratricopeptide repeat protein [Vicinamibacterales bacterium]